MCNLFNKMKDYIIDAKNQTLGRLSSKIALLLQDKDRPSYNPRLAGENRITVKNAHLIKVTGRKEKQKTYYRHTGYIGHLKAIKFQDMLQKDPARVLRLAVKGMLPKNRLLDKRLKRLIIEKEIKENNG